MPSQHYYFSDDRFQSFCSHHFQLKTVTEAWERRQYFALRKKVFSEEQKIFTGSEKDSADFRSIAIIALSNCFAVADDVVGAVRIYRDDNDEPHTWFGGRLCVAQSYRSSGKALGMALINEAVCRAKDSGARRFFANVQPQNQRYFQRYHWQPLAEVRINGMAHIRMQADLTQYPLIPRCKAQP